MIYLRRSCLKAARFKKQSGQITVWLSLSFLVFLSLYLACFQSVQKQFQRSRAEQAVESGMFSLFSEFEPHLLEEYDLFFLDTSFRTGKERPDEVCGHLWRFIEDNLSVDLELQGINIKNPERATDQSGAVFYRQAIQVMKERTGAALAEDWLMQESLQKEYEKNSQKFQEDKDIYSGSVRSYEDEEDEVDAEAYEWDGLSDSFSLSVAVPDSFVLSGKTVDLSGAPSCRELSAGVGAARESIDGLLEKQWFISYLCEYLKNAQETLTLNEEEREGYLDYQMEYVLCGNASDRENLEQVVKKLLLVREGVNYVFLLSHPDFSHKAELLAVLLVGRTGSKSLVKSVKHLILLGWAYGESLVEVRQLLKGYELSVLKKTDDWQVPLMGLLALIGNPGKYDEQSVLQKGIGYELFLRGFLTLQSRETLAMRSLDIIEGELQKKEGCEKIHLDHCVEMLTAQVWINGIFMERTYGYE